jgi:H+/Cl- antiporter ClcA
MAPKDNPAEAILRSRGQYKLILISVLAGICGGMTAVLYRLTLSWTDALRTELYAFADTPVRIIILFAVLLLLGAVAGKITQSTPLIMGSGIPQVEGQVMGFISPKWLPVLIKKFIGGALCMLGGLALGREGPSIQLGAMATQGMTQKLKCSETEKKYLITCGACGGLAAAFNAPLAGMMFGLEEIHKNFSALAIFPAMVAAITADLISKGCFGIKASLSLGVVELLPLRYYLMFAAVGILMGAFGAFYNKFLLSLQKAYKKLPVPVWVRIMIPFVAAGIVGLICPEMLGAGHNIIEELSGGNLTLSVMLVFLAGRFLFSMICFCSGAPGGIFFPLLVLGSLAGCICGKIAVLFFGIPQTDIINFMLLGMAGMFAGIVRAPITGVILVMEMSGSLTQMAGITITACCATLTANLLGSRPIYESLLKNYIGGNEGGGREKDNIIIEHLVTLHSSMTGGTVSRLNLPKDCLILSINRGQDKLIPKGGSVLQAGDLLHIACPRNSKDALMKMLNETESL